MSDASNPRPSNSRPRPLGEVKAERVCFDTPSDYRPWPQGGAVAFPLGGTSATPQGGAAENPAPRTDGDPGTGKAPPTVRSTPLHSTASVLSSSRNEHQEDRSSQTSPRADNGAALTLLTSLVSNRMRSISIPKRQMFDIPGPVIQCSMAPTSNVDHYYESHHALVESPDMNVAIHSPDSLTELKSLNSPDEGRSVLLSDHDNLSIGTPTRSGYGARDERGPSKNRDQRGGHAQCGMRMGQRQKRHLTTSRRKEMVKRLSEVSKCDAIDILDSEVHKDISTPGMPPMIIMSNKKNTPPTREKTMPVNGDTQLSRAQSISSLANMKKKRRSICINDCSVSVRGGLDLQRENSGFFQSEKLFGGIVGKGFDHKQAMALGKSLPLDTYSGLAPMRHPQMPKGRLLSHSTAGEDYRNHTLAHNMVLRNPPIPAIRCGTLNRLEEISLEGRNLQTLRSNTMLALPTTPASRRATRQDGDRTHIHADIDEHLIDKLNHKFDELQKQISLTLQRPGAYWTQPEPIAAVAVPKAKSSSSRDAAYWSSRTTSSASVDASENPSKGVTPKRSPESRAEGRDESMATCLETAKLAARIIEERARSSRLGEGRSQRASRANSRLGSGRTVSDVVDGSCGDGEGERGRDVERQRGKDGERERERDRDLQGGFPALHRSMTVPEDTLCSRMANAEAKDQGSTSKVNEMETSSQIHVIACKHVPAENNKYKVLKALDQEVYSDFQHKKYRKNGHTVLGKIDKPRIHLLKINMADQE